MSDSVVMGTELPAEDVGFNEMNDGYISDSEVVSHLENVLKLVLQVRILVWSRPICTCFFVNLLLVHYASLFLATTAATSLYSMPII